jgi:hypothetical protein
VARLALRSLFEAQPRSGRNSRVDSGLQTRRTTSSSPASSSTAAGNDVTNHHTAICFVIGSRRGYGIANAVVLDRNRIHDCGRLPPTNQEHGIYVAAARGTQITNNLIYDNADRGIQLYPDAQGSRIAYNVIDGNGAGIIFSGADGVASSNNRVERNVITNANVGHNVESWYPDGTSAGVGNLVTRNCLWNGAEGNLSPQIGFSANGNVVANPLYVDRVTKDFRLGRGTPCEGAGPR